MAPVFAVAAYYLALLNPRDALHAVLWSKAVS